MADKTKRRGGTNEAFRPQVIEDEGKSLQPKPEKEPTKPKPPKGGSGISPSKDGSK